MDEHQGLIAPFTSSYGAPATQQVMSPTRAATPVLEHETRVYSGSTLPPENAQSGAEGFEPRAAGRASGSAGQHESLQDRGSITGVDHHGTSFCAVAQHDAGRKHGEAASGGVVAEDFHEGFVTPRSQQGLPTIAEMVEGVPSASRFMSGIGSFFRVARTEVMQVPRVWHDTHDTPPRSATLSRDSPEGQRALGERSLGSHSSSPPTLGLQGAPTSFTFARLPKGMASC